MSDVPCSPKALTVHDLMALRAYEIWESHGSPKGHEIEHWLQAEREILDTLASNKHPGAQPEGRIPETRRSA